jgi:hypothetical protein
MGTFIKLPGSDIYVEGDWLPGVSICYDIFMTKNIKIMFARLVKGNLGASAREYMRYAEF